MPINQLGPVDNGFVDKRRALRAGPDSNVRTTKGSALFTANAVGLTTTLVGADGVVATSVNVARLNEKFRLFTAAGVLKEETVFTITGLASAAGTTTVTFTPPAATATASTNVARAVDDTNIQDDTNMDARLVALGRSASDIRNMTQNDKVYALRIADDIGGV